MSEERCWNCKSVVEKVQSRKTGNVYCSSCGAAINGWGAVTDLDLIDTEPVRREPDQERPSS